MKNWRTYLIVGHSILIALLVYNKNYHSHRLVDVVGNPVLQNGQTFTKSVSTNPNKDPVSYRLFVKKPNDKYRIIITTYEYDADKDTFLRVEE